MDNFEEYINEHREELDDMEDVPVGAMWSKIKGNLEDSGMPNLEFATNTQQRKIRVLRGWVMGLAASILVLIVAGIALWPNKELDVDKPIHLENPLATISEELAGTEQDLKKMIAHKEEEINSQHIDKQLFTEIFEELELLEKIHLEYQQDIPEFQEKEQLIKTLLRYYEQKIRILERLSREIDQQNHYQKKIYEKHL